MEQNTICILGMGYIGLPTACMFAGSGLQVTGVDVNQRVLSILHNGGLHIHEPGLREIASEALASGKLVVQDRPVLADAFIIAVPTPFTDDKKADLRAVRSAASAIVPYLKRGNLVVLESTSPPRTTVDVVAPILEQSGLRAGEDFYLAYSPERVLPGRILHELVHNDRVIGGITLKSAQAGRDLYAHFVRGRIVLTDATTAEMVKLMENTYRDINIAIANEFERLADRFHVNIWEAIGIANLHPRVKILNPGIGVGGHCISVDPWFLVEAAPDIASLINIARMVNDAQPEFVAGCLEQEYGPLAGKRIALLGLAYKADVDDLRESPAVALAKRLFNRAAVITAYEPYKTGGAYEGIPLAATLEDALQDADIILLAVGHSQFTKLQPEEVALLTKCRSLFDPIHGWRAEEWKNAGFLYHGLATGQENLGQGETWTELSF